MKKDLRFIPKLKFVSSVRKRLCNLNPFLIFSLLGIGFFYLSGRISKDTVTRNYGFVFGMVSGNPALWLILLLLFVCAIFFFYSNSNLSNASLLIILTGGLSNLFERLTKGYISDYINFFNLLYFNFADLLIVIGGILCVKEILWKNKK